jgi:WD40 repeat protein
VAIGPASRRILTGGANQRARFWEADTLKERPEEELHHPDEITSAAFGAADNRVLTGCKDGLGRLWAIPGQQELYRQFPHGKPVWAVARSADGELVATGGDGGVRIWFVSSGRAVGPPLPQWGEVNSVAFDYSGDRLLTGSKDGTALLWAVPGLDDSIPIAELRRQVQRRTGLKLDPHDTLVVLDFGAWKDRE